MSEGSLAALPVLLNNLNLSTAPLSPHHEILTYLTNPWTILKRDMFI